MKRGPLNWVSTAQVGRTVPWLLLWPVAPLPWGKQLPLWGRISKSQLCRAPAEDPEVGQAGITLFFGELTTLPGHKPLA